MSDKLGLTPVGRVIFMSRAARFYRNGDSAGFLWRWWHPIAWIVAPLGFVASVIVTGIPDTWRYKHELGFGMNPWFKQRPDELRWLTPPGKL